MKPRIGSVSSCSGEGKARGATETRAAASRSAAAVVVTSEFVRFSGLENSIAPADFCPFDERISAKEFRRRWGNVTLRCIFVRRDAILPLVGNTAPPGAFGIEFGT